MSIAEEARRQTEFALRAKDLASIAAGSNLPDLRATETWRSEQTELGNGIIKVAPDLIASRAADGHLSAWIMDVTPEQYQDAETPTVEFPLAAVQKLLFGAARIVAEYLISEGCRVVIRHKGKLNGVNQHQMEARWSH